MHRIEIGMRDLGVRLGICWVTQDLGPIYRKIDDWELTLAGERKKKALSVDNRIFEEDTELIEKGCRSICKRRPIASLM